MEAMLIQLVIALIIVGLVVWLVQNYLPVPPMFKNLIIVVLVLILIIFLLRIFGIIRT